MCVLLLGDVLDSCLLLLTPSNVLVVVGIFTVLLHSDHAQTPASCVLVAHAGAYVVDFVTRPKNAQYQDVL